MTRHLAKLFESIWYVSMGLFLGLTGGLVLSVILTFRGARAIDATPGVEPFGDPTFAEYHNDAVAGYIGQDLFMVGGTVALVLIAIAFLAVTAHSLIVRREIPKRRRCRATVGTARVLAAGLCLGAMVWGALHTASMNHDWPGLYDVEASDDELTSRREAFEIAHQQSELIVQWAWFMGLFALSISPWCRRIADDSSQTEIDQQK